jgi:hypothetical protein
MGLAFLVGVLTLSFLLALAGARAVLWCVLPVLTRPVPLLNSVDGGTDRLHERHQESHVPAAV